MSQEESQHPVSVCVAEFRGIDLCGAPETRAICLGVRGDCHGWSKVGTGQSWQDTS